MKIDNFSTLEQQISNLYNLHILLSNGVSDLKSDIDEIKTYIKNHDKFVIQAFTIMNFLKVSIIPILLFSLVMLCFGDEIHAMRVAKPIHDAVMSLF